MNDGLGTPDEFKSATLARLRSLRAASASLNVLLVSSPEPAGKDQIGSIRRALRMLGHQVFNVSSSRHPELVLRKETPKGPVAVLSLQGITKIMDTFHPDVVMVANYPHPIDDASKTWAAERGILLVLLDTLPGSLLTARTIGTYDAFAGPTPSKKLGTIPFLLSVDASLAMRLMLQSFSTKSSFGFVDSLRMEKEFPRLFAVASQDPLAKGTRPESKGTSAAVEDALIHVYPPTFTSRRHTTWQSMLSVMSGSAVLVPRELKLPEHLAAVKSVSLYDGEKHLTSLLAELGSEGESLRHRNRTSALDLLSCPLLEDQLSNLFDTLRFLQSPPDSVRRRIAEGWAPTGELKKRVVAISGWYGERNLGDEIILEALLQGLRRTNPGGQVVVAGPRPANVERDHAVVSVPRHEMAASAQLANYADCLIVGGGGIWNDKSVARNGGLAGLFRDPRHSVVNLATLPILFRSLGKPIAGLGLGVGPLREESARSIVRLMASLTSVLSVRDAHSKKLLIELGTLGTNASVDGDLAFAWNKPSRVSRVSRGFPLRPLVGVNVRFPDGVNPSSAGDSWPGLSDALGSLAAKHDCDFVGIPFQAEDVIALERLFKGTSNISYNILPFTTDAAQVAADLQVCDMLVAMRLHASILSHRAGVIAIGLDYEEKIGDYFREVGEEERLISKSNTINTLSSAITETFERRKAAADRLLPVIANLELSVRQNLDRNLNRLLVQPDSHDTVLWSL